MSHIPLCDAPSLPVTPARSRTKVMPAWCSAASMSSWSKARLRKVAYTATTGCRPANASPLAMVTACCSAMPTSNTRSGWTAANPSSPTGMSMAAVRATRSGRSEPRATISSLNSSVQMRPLTSNGSPVSGLNLPTPWNWSASSLMAGS